ncbi:MAG: hypothetical protein ACE5K7_06650, partial [Phycisphaerae bacterium]
LGALLFKQTALGAAGAIALVCLLQRRWAELARFVGLYAMAVALTAGSINWLTGGGYLDHAVNAAASLYSLRYLDEVLAGLHLDSPVMILVLLVALVWAVLQPGVSAYLGAYVAVDIGLACLQSLRAGGSTNYFIGALMVAALLTVRLLQHLEDHPVSAGRGRLAWPLAWSACLGCLVLPTALRLPRRVALTPRWCAAMAESWRRGPELDAFLQHVRARFGPMGNKVFVASDLLGYLSGLPLEYLDGFQVSLLEQAGALNPRRLRSRLQDPQVKFVLLDRPAEAPGYYQGIAMIPPQVTQVLARHFVLGQVLQSPHPEMRMYVYRRRPRPHPGTPPPLGL